MTSNLKMALSAATLVAGLALTAPPALAQFAAGAGGGGGAVMHGGGGAIGGGGAAIGGGGGFGGGFGGGHVGAPIAAPSAPAAPQFHAAPAVVPQARVPQVAPGGGYGVPRVRNPGGTPMAHGSPWNGGVVTQAPRQPRTWPGHGGVTRPYNNAQIYHGGRHHRGHGHWRRGVWYPYALGGYDYTYGVYDDDDYCTLRKVRVHTPYGWRRVWRRVCV